MTIFSIILATLSVTYGVLYFTRNSANRAKEILSAIFWTIIIVSFAWFALSYINILCHNLDGAQYADWNLIIKMMGILK